MSLKWKSLIDGRGIFRVKEVLTQVTQVWQPRDKANLFFYSWPLEHPLQPCKPKARYSWRNL